MKKNIILLLGIFFALKIFSQEENLQFKLDSIINEADLLYCYEKSVWQSTDLLVTDKELWTNHGGYIVYHSNDTLFVTFCDKDMKKSIAKYSFVKTNLITPIQTIKEASPLTNIEQEFLDVKLKIIDQLSEEKYSVVIPQDYNPNLVLLKENNGFKLYILMGTSASGVIPFGNDYLFRTDLKGEIIDWRKFHSIMIPAQSKLPNGQKITSVMHSHLESTPYTTATDICTFRLYGELCGMKEFSVACTSTRRIYKYNIETNRIEITEM